MLHQTQLVEFYFHTSRNSHISQQWHFIWFKSRHDLYYSSSHSICFHISNKPERSINFMIYVRWKSIRVHSLHGEGKNQFTQQKTCQALFHTIFRKLEHFSNRETVWNNIRILIGIALLCMFVRMFTFLLLWKEKAPRELFKTISRIRACNARLWIDLFLLISVVFPLFLHPNILLAKKLIVSWKVALHNNLYAYVGANLYTIELVI